MDQPIGKLEETLFTKLLARKEKSTFRKLTTSSPNSVDFSSNDFLSLSTCSQLRAAFLEELNKYSDTFPLGSGGSRLLDGNSSYADNLEQSIAEFHHAPAGLLWNSGFDANSGLFACIPQPGDVIIHDELIHASVHDGMKLSRASQKIPFQHNSVSHLRHVIEQLIGQDPTLSNGRKNIFIAVESIYSMDGDIAPLAEIVALKLELLPQNGHIIIDEAHGTGVLGPRGSGLVCELGLEDEVFARLHTFGKSLACSGAIVLCSPIVRSYLINYARPLIYTTFLPFPSLAAITASYSLLRSGYTEQLTRHLQSLIVHFHALLHRIIAKHAVNGQISHILNVHETCPRSPIFSLETEHPRSLAKFCQDNGFVVRAVVPPTVPTRRVRVCLHAGNTFDQIEGIAKLIHQWLQNMLQHQMSLEDHQKARL